MVKDAPLPQFLQGLTQEVSNIWLSDGNTVGKLHFDGSDNILVQLVGTKNLTIFHPHDNANLYEGHIQEAQFEAEIDLKMERPWNFSRNNLLDSTSMVMSPIDLSNVDFNKFPKFRAMQKMNCAIGPGDALFLPSFWWHEVVSQPDKDRKFNLALNFWFEPFYKKEFPCANCNLDINPNYFRFIDKYL